MRQVDIAHQPEDQREAARDQEIESAERDAVEDGVEEDFLAADRLFKPRRPDREDQPEQHRDRDQDDQRPGGMAFDEPAHVSPRAVRTKSGPRSHARGLAGWSAIIMLSSRRAWRPLMGHLSCALSKHPSDAARGGLDRQYLFEDSRQGRKTL